MGASGEEVVEPLARWVQLQAVARVRRHERTPAAVLLHAQLAQLGARERCDEIIFVECESEVIESRQLPLSRLDDDVHGSPLQLRQPQLEADPVELLPAVPRLEGGRLVLDPAVPGDEAEAELAEIARLDLPHLARHQVVMEELHEGRLEPCSPRWRCSPGSPGRSCGLRLPFCIGCASSLILSSRCRCGRWTCTRGTCRISTTRPYVTARCTRSSTCASSRAA